MEGPAVSLQFSHRLSRAGLILATGPTGLGPICGPLPVVTRPLRSWATLSRPRSTNSGQALRSSLDAIGTYEAPCSPGPEMLSGGVLPLDLLDARTDSWIKAQKAGAPPSN